MKALTPEDIQDAQTLREVLSNVGWVPLHSFRNKEHNVIETWVRASRRCTLVMTDDTGDADVIDWRYVSFGVTMHNEIIPFFD